ncbi:MAG: hypothetical protein AB7V00_00885 [Bacilli bacterium]
MNKWYRLDNAAKVFPSVSGRKRSNIFRLAMTLKEEVDPDILQIALEETINRFPSFKVKLKRGFFWFYFEENLETPKVAIESPNICKNINFRDQQKYLFRLNYYHNRISLEMFHALTDGSGALEFLKAIVYKYLLLMGKQVRPENVILTDIETRNEESQDSFVQNYSTKVKAIRKEKKALKLKGNRYQHDWITVVNGTVGVDKLKEVSKKYQMTITEFISTCLNLAASKSINLFENKNRPFQLFIPVNMRRFFPSKTLRNFSLYIRTSMFLNDNMTFDEVRAIVKDDFSHQLQKESLHQLLMANVKIEKNIVMRLVPLFLKEIVLKIGYNAWGDSPNSICYSNLGVCDLPQSMHEYINDVIFTNGATFTTPINIGSISFGNKMVFSISSSMLERNIQRDFFRLLAEFGLDVIVETNELEV